MNDNSRVEFISETGRNRPEIVGSDNRLPRLRIDRIGARPISPLLRRSPTPTPDLSLLRHDRSRTPSPTRAVQPLIEPDVRDNEPPLAGPEIDSDDDLLPPKDKPIDDDTTDGTTHGIDDGFLTPDVAKEGGEPEAEDVDPDLINTIFNIKPRADGDGPVKPPVSDDTPSVRPMSPNPSNFPIAPGFDVNSVASYPPGTVIGIDGMITLPDGRRIPDVNVYQHKKTLAQGMMDLALFSANANQLRYVLESSPNHPYHLPGIILIALSLILQIAIGCGLIWNSRYNVRDDRQICVANKINNFTIMGIFVVTVLNVFISVFSVGTLQAAPVAAVAVPIALNT